MHGNGTTDTYGGAPLFHGRFIPDQRNPLPWPVRLLIAVGLAVIIIGLFIASSDILSSWGAWVCPLIITIFGVASIVAWIVDEVRHPSIDVEDGAA
jgi:hypothetical protein